MTADPTIPPNPDRSPALRVGVLASQGGFAAHITMLRQLGADAVEVRAPADLIELDALIIPGGESTTISKAIERDQLAEPIRDLVAGGGALLGTCAGMIVCDREHLGLLDARVERNAYGRQIASFEADLEIEGIGPEPLRAVFIRAPRIAERSAQVESLAELDGHPVAVRQGKVIACSFHPELTDDPRLHALLMAVAGEPRHGREASGRMGEAEA